ncbi:uncharacterized protein LOC122498939 [Leptopilina heterotoma]|uniref:uncharacterized protein LOC122498939 n=1 Tax=Leptopilina heterotoma TaxID=63436 RepID=UPI001CA7E65D|nr:uncharacterized protein LOC122498939 [Leptopilina heterotoma]
METSVSGLANPFDSDEIVIDEFESKHYQEHLVEDQNGDKCILIGVLDKAVDMPNNVKQDSSECIDMTSNVNQDLSECIDMTSNVNQDLSECVDMTNNENQDWSEWNPNLLRQKKSSALEVKTAPIEKRNQL